MNREMRLAELRRGLRLDTEGRGGEVRGGFATVSGILTTRPEMIRELDSRIPQLLMITTKSYQVEPNPGNREPIIAETAPGCFGNAVGLKNPGMKVGLEELQRMREGHTMRALLNVSLSGSTPEEFVRLAEGFSVVADTLELNFSCPHAEPGYGMSIGVDPELVYRYLSAVRDITDLPLLPKLTPNVDAIGEAAAAAVEGGADGLVAINTVGPELYIEAHSGKPILMNPHGGRGGKSGRWVRETALEKVAQIRDRVGDELPIIGMGGVETTEHVRDMRRAGADIVGIGSAFAMVMPEDWNSWFDKLETALDEPIGDNGRETDARAKTPYTHAHTHEHRVGPETELSAGQNGGRSLLIEERQMEYRPYTVTEVDDGPEGLKRITLDGSIDFEPGQFVFLWLPEVGEKPFSVALSDPLSFLVRPRGPMTEVLCALRPGDSLYVRGVYGRGAEITEGTRAWILAGGTGLAVAPPLASALEKAGKRITTFAALSDGNGDRYPTGAGAGSLGNGLKENGSEETEANEDARQAALFGRELSAYGEYRVIPDDGEIGRAVRVFSEEVAAAGPPEEQSLYVIGPFPFMHAAAEAGRRAGIDPSQIQMSIETKTRCGVGLCGECACAGRLTCREGTFFRLDEFDRRGVRITECGDDH